MAGTIKGGKLAARTNKEKYGDDFYVRIGSTGGKRGTTGGFASEKIGKDGLTGKQRARIAGQIGGTISRKNKKDGAVQIEPLMSYANF